MLTVNQLFIYPIKSLGGIEVSSAKVTDRGFEYDRRWMLVDDTNCFLSQRELPEMSLLQVRIESDGLYVFTKKDIQQSIFIPFEIQQNKSIQVKVWDDLCDVVEISGQINEWFSTQLKQNCKLVFMPENSIRKVDKEYATNGEVTSFSDGYPFLLIGQSSLDDINSRLNDQISIERFRPNIVFTGGVPFQEDTMEHFTINQIDFYGVKLCGRCVITTINPDNATISKEPLKTLSTYRMKNNKVYFGQNLLHKGNGLIHVGDELIILKQKENVF